MTCPDCPDLGNGTHKRAVCCRKSGLALKIGDRVPMPPPPKLDVRPAHWVDDKARGPRGVFHNGAR